MHSKHKSEQRDNASVSRRSLLTGGLASTAIAMAAPAEASANAIVDKVNRLGLELADALNTYADGRFCAEIQPSRTTNWPVAFGRRSGRYANLGIGRISDELAWLIDGYAELIEQVGPVGDEWARLEKLACENARAEVIVNEVAINIRDIPPYYRELMLTSMHEVDRVFGQILKVIPGFLKQLHERIEASADNARRLLRERLEEADAWCMSSGYNDAEAAFKRLTDAMFKMEIEISEFECSSFADAMQMAKFAEDHFTEEWHTSERSRMLTSIARGFARLYEGEA
ncbi:hypothetical protein [Pararhizobium sp.]|uniref:hypothetical protein n=1 Tax=Pararhizobium sp. TaxID=1977563 RepID=UPI002724018C|nr:hypothetical protein [Pararhizobium sp.]MDO9417974.1 hypothetical protein [Pararhizobium sp.]